MDSTDIDDQPSVRREAKAPTKENSGLRSKSGSPLPEWLSENNSPVKTLDLLSDSDEVVEVECSENESEEAPRPGPGSAAEASQANKRKRAAPAPGRRKVTRVLLSSENEDSGGDRTAEKSRGSARKKQKQTESATQQSQKSVSLARENGKTGHVASGKPGAFGRKAALQQNSKEAEEHDQDNGVERTQADPVEANDPRRKDPKAAAAKAAALAPVSGEIPIMMPEKLPVTKVIVELESGNDSSVDLTGDAGVVGRWLVEGSEKNPELKMDLKGVVYAATTVPCATTLCVVNLSATEARVEAMTQQYIQLRPLEGPGASGDDNADDNYFMYDDDENYQYEGASQRQEAVGEAGPSGAGTKKKAKKAPTKRAGASGKIAKKKPTKAAAGGRSKSKK